MNVDAGRHVTYTVHDMGNCNTMGACRMGMGRSLTCMYWNGLFQIEHGLFPVGGWVLRTGAEVNSILLGIESYVEIPHQSLR